MTSSVCRQPRPVIFTSIRVAVSGATRVYKLALSATRTRGKTVQLITVVKMAAKAKIDPDKAARNWDWSLLQPVMGPHSAF